MPHDRRIGRRRGLNVLLSLIPVTLYAQLMLGISQCSSDSDADGDGWTVEDGDCDDGDGSVHPGATESCSDLVDSDCNPATGCTVQSAYDQLGRLIQWESDEALVSFEYDSAGNRITHDSTAK